MPLGITTISEMTLCKMTNDIRHYYTQQNNKKIWHSAWWHLILSAAMLCVIYAVCHIFCCADCRYAGCCYAECHGAKMQAAPLSTFWPKKSIASKSKNQSTSLDKEWNKHERFEASEHIASWSINIKPACCCISSKNKYFKNSSSLSEVIVLVIRPISLDLLWFELFLSSQFS